MSNRDVAPRLRALDERVKEWEGGGMNDLEQKAREIFERIELHSNGEVRMAIIVKALADVREADAQVAEQYSVGFSKEATVYLVSHDIAAAIRTQGVK